MISFIQTENKLLLPFLQKVIGVADQKAMTIFGNVLLEQHENGLRLSCIDDTMQISANIPQLQGGDIAITTNAKKLLTILKSFNNDDNVNLKLADNHEKIFINCNKSRFQLQTLPPEDFPTLEFEEDAEEEFSFSIPKRDFKHLLKQTQYAIAQNDIRYYLNGLHLDITSHKIVAVATNGHCLAYAAMLFENELPTTCATIPKKAVTELIKLVNDSNDLITITINKSAVKFEFDDIILISKVIDGKYPEYKSVIPENFNIAFKVNRLELIKAINQSALVIDKNSNGVKFSLTENNLQLLTQNHENEDCEINIPIEYNGEPFTIGFNISYVLEKLNNTTDDEVIFRFRRDVELPGMISGYSYRNASESDLRILPIEQDTFDETLLIKDYEKYVVMPMRI